MTPLEPKGAHCGAISIKNIHPMKNITPILVLLLLPAILNAAIWRVDDDPGRIADFTSLQAAVDDNQVMPDDIIYIAGTAIDYGTVIISKRLFVFGPGYLLTENTGESAAVSPATFTQIQIGVMTS